MATLTCTAPGCSGEFAPGDFICPRCSAPRPSTSVTRPIDLEPEIATGPQTLTEPEPAPAATATAPVTETASASETVPEGGCDHADNPPGSVMCLTCFEPLRRAEPAAPPVAVVHRLAAPWGTVDLTETHTDVGREVGPWAEELEPFDTISRRHATLRVTTSGRLHVIDHGSTNGTWRNGEKLATHVATELAAGDQVCFSRSVCFGVLAPTGGSDR